MNSSTIVKNPPYKFTWADKEVPIFEGSSVTTTKTYMENYKNVSRDIRDQVNAKAEAVQIILTGIDNDIYSTVDACPNACEMWKHQNEVNEIRAKRIARTANPLALVAQQQPVYHPQNHPTHYTHNSSTRSQQPATRNIGKAIVNSPQPIYDQEPSMVAKDDEMSKDKEIDKLMALISLSIGNIIGARETVGTTVELEAHYMYMAQIQEVSQDAADSGPIFDAEPLQKVSNDDHYNVFSIKSEHPEQSKSVHDTYLIEQDEHNVTIDSLDMSYDSEQIDQNDDDNDLANEHFKIQNKSLESSNNRFKETNNKLSETNALRYKDLKKFQAELYRRNDVEYASKVEINCAKAKGDLISYKMESQKSFNKYTQHINDLNQTILDIKKKLSPHQETISILSQAKEAQIKLYKTREDKELDKIITLENKVKVLDDTVYKTGQSVQTMNMLNNKCRTSFAKPEFLKKAQRANPRLYDIGCYNYNLALMLAPESDEVIRLEKESRSKLSDLFRPFDYNKLNNFYDLFVPQCEKSSEQRYFSERSRMSHTPVNNGNSKESYHKQTNLLETWMDESIPWDQKCKSSKELFKIKRSVGTIFDGVERCKETIAKRTYFGHIDPFIQNTIEANFSPKIQKINADLEKIHVCLKEEMIADLRYFSSLELEVDSLKSQLETEKTQFLNEIDRIFREYYYADHMNAILGVYTELDEVTNLQCNYLELLEKCDKGIVISELKKLIEKLKGKSVDTKFENSSIIRQPNAFKSQRPSILGKPTTFSDSLKRKDLSKSKSVTKNNVSNDFSKPVTAQILPTIKKSTLKNTNALAPGMTKMPIVVLVSTREPKCTVKQSVAKTLRKILVEIVLFIVDSRCSKHMTGNLKLLIYFVEKFLGTVKFRNDQIAPILGYGDLVQGAITIKRVYYVEGLNHNLFSVGQFCDADFEVAFRKSTCYIRNLKGNDLLTGSRETDLYLITLQDTNYPNPICLMAKATSSQAWLWHRRLSHLNFDTINMLSKNDIVNTPSSKRRLQHLHMDLCGPMRVASINGERYVLVIIDDYSRYTWTYFLRSKDETPEVLIDFLRLVQRGLHAQIRIVRTDKGTEFLNQTLYAYVASEGIHHQTSVAQTPEQNGVVERQNRTLVEAARTMLSAAKVPLFFWAEAITTTCFTQNRSLVIPRHEKTPYHIINDQKSKKVMHVYLWGILLSQELQDHVSSDPEPQCQSTALKHNSLSLGPQCQENVPQADTTVTTSNELDLLFSLMFAELLNGSSQVVSKSSTVTTADVPNQRQQQHTTPLNNQTTPEPTCQVLTQAPTVTSTENINQAEMVEQNAQVADDEFINIFYTPVQDRWETSSRHVDSSNMHTFYQHHPSEHLWTKDHLLEQVIRNPSQTVRTRRQLESDGEMCMFALTASRTELKNIKEAMDDSAWIESMQEELHYVGTPMATKHLDAYLSGTLVDQTKYQSMVGALMYLIASRPDIMHATCYCARYQANPTEKHLTTVKRIFRYLKDTIRMGLWYPKDIGFELTAFLDSDHVGCLDSCKSTSGGIQFLGGDKLVSCSSKKQDYTSMSSVEVEYVSLSAYCAQVLWMRTQLTDHGFHFDKIPMYYDSKAAIAISCNPVQHSRTKHIDVRYHFIKEKVEKGIVELLFVETEYQLPDMFTKVLPEERFKYLVRRLGMRCLTPEELEVLANESA
nr:hypothetical protein [Tanacetum cinerariifolium]